MKFLGSLGFYSCYNKYRHVDTQHFNDFIKVSTPFQWTYEHEKLAVDHKQNQWGLDSRHVFHRLCFSHSRGFIERWFSLDSNPTVPWRVTKNVFQFQNLRQSRTENVYPTQRFLRNSFSCANLWTLHYCIPISNIFILWSQTDFLFEGM